MMSPLRFHHSQSVTELAEEASASDQTIIFAPEGTERIMDSEIHLKGIGARSESTTCMVTAGGAITNRNMLKGEVSDTRGFLGCDGLKIGEAARSSRSPA